MKIHDRKMIIFGFILGITISLSCFLIGYISFLYPKLDDFKLTSFARENDTYVLKFAANRNAVKYQVLITDNNADELYNNTFTTNEIEFNDLYLKYQEEINIDVYAIDKNDIKKKSSNTIKDTWQEMSFKDHETYYANQDEDFIITVAGLEQNPNNQIVIYNEGKKVNTYPVTNTSVHIPYQDIKAYSGRLIAYIVKNDATYDKMNFYINTTLVGNIEITGPLIETSYDWQDIKFNYSGGANASKIYLNIINAQTNKIHKKIILNQEESIIDAYSFKENTSYILEVRAVFKDYEEIARHDSIKVNIGKIPEMQPVYIEHNPDNIPKDTVIELKTRSTDGIIKYTIDGSNPDKNSPTYINPIKIDKNMTIKAYTYKEKTIVSKINTYEFNIGNKSPVIYLSPSRQAYNPGIIGSNYTNEYLMMNKVSDLIQGKLKEKGIKVYRNNPNTDMMEWLAESRYVKSDLHFAIHSNGSPKHDANGIEIWVHDQTSKSLSIATVIYNNLYAIYPYQSKAADRGVRFAEGSLGEVHPSNHSHGVLIEIGFHDNMNDATWMVENIEEISNNITNSILNYYQVK